jgi:hypothetical protein
LSPSHAYHRETLEAYLFGTGCRRWDCAICGACKRWQLVKQITDAAPTKFITLTCRHEGEPRDQLNAIKTALPKLITRIRKSQACEYVRITEDCVDGYPHFHVLARTGFIRQDELSNAWKRLTNANIVDIRKAHGKSTRYVAKYVGKHLTHHDARQRYAVSRKFFIPKPKHPTDMINWEHLHEHFLEATERITARNTLVTEAHGKWWIVEREPGDELPQEISALYPNTDEPEKD